MDEDKQSIAQRLLAESGVAKRISCTQARDIARELKVETELVGRLCDELGIKIYACELGCF